MDMNFDGLSDLQNVTQCYWKSLLLCFEELNRGCGITVLGKQCCDFEIIY